MRHNPLIYIYIYTPTLLTDLPYVQYLHSIWSSIKDDLPVLTDRPTPLRTVHSYILHIYIYIYIYMSVT